MKEIEKEENDNESEYLVKIPSYPRDRFKRYNKGMQWEKKKMLRKWNIYERMNPSRPRDRFKRYSEMQDKKKDKKDIKNKFEFDTNTTTEIPFINIDVPIDTTARAREKKRKRYNG